MQPENLHPPQPVARRRGGRPSAKQAGDVERRILQAATSLFLAQGFDATTCDQVAAQAGAGKASLYARYAGKEALFEAVIRDYVARTAGPAEREPVADAVRERLHAVGEGLLVYGLQSDVVAMMRAVITTAHRTPQLARFANDIGRRHCVHRVAVAIAGHAANDPDAVAQALGVAGRFVDMVVAPYQMRALMGEATADILDDARRGLAESIAMLAAGGWLERWEQDLAT